MLPGGDLLLANLHAISGLPRSGSTLLSAVLRQNPRFHAGIASPVHALVIAALDQMNPGREFAAFFSEPRRRTVLRGLFATCYAEAGRDDVVFDSNRMWTGQTALLRELFPEIRIICCVREIGWIINSIELMLRRNPLQTSRLFDFKSGTSFYSRVQGLMHTDFGAVGLALGELRQAWFSEDADRLVVVRYESLVRDPRSVIARIYHELGEPQFEHDFENLAYDAPEFDARLGMPGLHKVTGRVRSENPEAIIPPEIFAKYVDIAFWNQPQQNPRGVLTL
jgi:sulfotransferase